MSRSVIFNILIIFILSISIVVGVDSFQRITCLQIKLDVQRQQTDVVLNGNHSFLLSRINKLQEYLEQEIQDEAATRVFHNWALQKEISKLRKEKGEKGDTGLQGEKGDTGATGLWGLRGPQGVQGERGYSVDLPKLYKQTSPAVVWIGAEYNGDEFISRDNWNKISERDKNIPITVKWQGTGFLVNAVGLIATAGHVCKNTKTFIIQFQDGSRTYADFVHMENLERCDVGFIKLRSDTKRPYFNLDTEIEMGESLIILGYPWGLNNGIALTQGVVSLSNRKELFFGIKLVMHVDVASYPGNSGSPVINMDGEVVGILIGGRYGCDNWSIVTRTRLVELAMQKALAEIGLREAK